MKRSAAWILAVVLFVVAAAGGAALMYFSPRGVLNPSSPESAMQSALDTGSFNWHDEFTTLYTAEVTPFEDADAVTEAIYAALAGNESLPSGSGRVFPPGISRYSSSPAAAT